jgi:hypothetical protein
LSGLKNISVLVFEQYPCWTSLVHVHEGIPRIPANSTIDLLPLLTKEGKDTSGIEKT